MLRGWIRKLAVSARNCLEVIDVGLFVRDPVPKLLYFYPKGIGLMPRLPGNSRSSCANELVLNNEFEVGGFELADVNAADSCPTENSILASWSSTALNIVFSESEYGWSRELSFRYFI